MFVLYVLLSICGYSIGGQCEDKEAEKNKKYDEDSTDKNGDY